MTIETAVTHLRTCRERMDALYQKVVFDEWVLIGLSDGQAMVHFYHGPRAEEFAARLHADSAPLYAAMERRHYEVGDFEFVLDAVASHYDACLKVGEDLFLLGNNTEGTMDVIRADPRWREAQKPFVVLTEKFRADPLVV